MEGMELMVKKIMHDPLFLAQKSVDATEADKQIVTDLLDTLNQYVFVRTHNRIVVNMKHIERVDYPNMEILLDSGDVIPISRSCKDIFKNAYTRFTRNFS